MLTNRMNSDGYSKPWGTSSAVRSVSLISIHPSCRRRNLVICTERFASDTQSNGPDSVGGESEKFQGPTFTESVL